MAKTIPTQLLTDELVMNKIHIIRGQKIMLDSDLAELYHVETKRLKEAVRRNMERFPHDFMFELSKEECDSLRTQFASSRKGKGGNRYRSMAFTEQGVAMLAGVLNSEIAIRVHIQIIRVFIKMREMLMTHKDVMLHLEKLEKKLASHDADIALIFKYLRQLLQPPESPRNMIGFRTKTG